MEEKPIYKDADLSEASKAALRVFITEARVDKLGKMLRNLFLGYISRELDTPPADLDDTIADLQALFDFLDVVEAENLDFA